VDRARCGGRSAPDAVPGWTVRRSLPGCPVAILHDVGSRNLRHWEFDGRFWTHVAVATPPQRWMVQTDTDQRHRTIVLSGGVGKNDTWTWDGIAWTQRFQLVSPPVRSITGPTPGDGLRRGRGAFFGGAGDGPILSDTWLWDGSEWRHAAQGRGPWSTAYGNSARRRDYQHCEPFVRG
jgi:hypothetical protein